MGNELVATQEYVYNLLVDVWNAIKSASSGVSSNGASIGGLGTKLNEMAITNIVAKVEIHGGYHAFRETYYFQTGVNKAGEYTFETGSGHYSAYAYHLHPVTAEISGTTLTVGTTDGAKSSVSNTGVDLKHSHTGKASFNNDGTVTITLDSSFNYATAATITSDSVTATQWYKDKIAEAEERGYQAAVNRCDKNGNTITLAAGSYTSQYTETWTAGTDHSYSYSYDHDFDEDGDCDVDVDVDVDSWVVWS